jgi:hypothetical protein
MGTALKCPIRTLAFAALLALGGCSPEWYALDPAIGGTALVAGRPAAYYPVPTTAPRGGVQVVSLGSTQIQLPEGPKIPVLQVRLVIDNHDVPWTIDTREQYGSIPGEGTSRPALVAADADGAPILTILPGGQRTIDLYFPLPSGMNDVDDIAHFDLDWRVDTGREVVAQRTPFDRVRIVQGPGPAYPPQTGTGLGPFYWYDPFWPDFTYDRPPIIYPLSPYPYPYRYPEGY